MQEAAEQVRRQLQDSGRPALVALPSVQPQVAPAAVLTQVRENDSFENPWRFIDGLRFQPQVRQEAQLMKQMQAMSAMADEEAKKLYIHRSLAFVFSALLSSKIRPEIKAQIDVHQIDLLTTEVNKLVNFKDFTARFSESLLNITRIMAAMDPKKMICTEPFLYQYMKTLDKLLLLNELCNRKESPSNEISHRKRVMTTTSRTSAQDVMQDMSTLELQKFFADKSSIINAFRKAFHVIPGGYIPMVVVCNLAAELYNRRVYFTPEEKYMLIRVMGLGLYLIEGAIKITEKDRQTMYDRAKDAVANGQVPDTNQYKNERVLATFHKGGLNLDLIKTILYENQNVPLIFECFVDSLKLCKDFSWDDAEDKSRDKKEKMDISEAASVYGEYVCSSMGRIITILRTRTESKRNRVRLNNPQMIRQGGEINQQSLGIGIDQNGQAQRLRPKDEFVCKAITADNKMILSAFEEAIRILSEMKQFLMEFLATKFAFPINKDALLAQTMQGGEKPKKNNRRDMNNLKRNQKLITEDGRMITAYELSVRYNISFEEKTGLCKLVTHITEFREFLLKNVVKVKREIDSAVFGEVQELCQLMLRRVLYKSQRNKKVFFFQEVLKIREVSASWAGGESFPHDPALQGKEDREFTPPAIGVKCAPIHPTQLFILQSNIANIASPRSPSLLKSMFSSAEIEPEEQQVLFEWLIRSFAFPHLLNIEDCIRTIGDLGQLWYREDFIERGKAREDIIQFPIESSLPWILTTHTLNYLPSETDTLLAIFDLYSAAADTALRQLKSRYLFDEIESEAKLGMQQLLFILPNNIYSYYKKLASAKLVETSYREVFDSIPRVMKGNVPQQQPAPQQSGDQQQQGGNPNQIQQGQPNTTQQGEAPKQDQLGQQSMTSSPSGNLNNQGVLLKQQVQIAPVQNDQERYLNRKGGEKMVGVSRYLVAKMPYDSLFLLRDITIVGHRLDFGGRLAAKIENLLIDNIEAGLQLVQNTSTIMMADILLKVLFDVHHQLEKDAIVHTSWSDLISSVKGRCSATSLQSSFVNVTSQMVFQEIGTQMILNFDTMHFVPKQRETGNIGGNSAFEKAIKLTRNSMREFKNDALLFTKQLNFHLSNSIAMNSMFFASHPHISALLHWMDPDEPIILVANICDLFPDIVEGIIQDARAIAAALPFAGRNTPALDPTGEEHRRFYHERRSALRNKQQTYTRLAALITRLGNILSFVIMLDEALASEDTIGFGINAASVGYSLRASYPTQTQMPGFLSRFHSNGIPPQPPDSELQTEQLIGSVLMNSGTELTLAPAALNSSIIHQRPLFAYAVQKLRQTVRNISQSQNIQLFNEHGPLTFAKPLPVAWKDVIGLPAELAKVGMRLPSGEMVQTTDIVSMEHPKMIYEVANAMIDEILFDLPSDYRFQTAMKDVAFKDNRVNLWADNGDGLWVGLCSLIHVSGQLLPFNMTSPLRITEVRVTVPQPPTLASTSKQEKDDFYSSKPPKADVLPYIAWARRLQHLMLNVFSILNVSIPLHPVTKNPLGSISGTSSAWNPSSMVRASVPSSTFTQYLPSAGNIAGIVSSHSALLPRQGDDVAVPNIPPVQRPQNQITHNFDFNPSNSQQNGIREPPLGDFGVFRQQMQRQASGGIANIQQPQTSAPSFNQSTPQLGPSGQNNYNNNNANFSAPPQFDSWGNNDIPPPPMGGLPPSMGMNPNMNMNGPPDIGGPPGPPPYGGFGDFNLDEPPPPPPSPPGDF